jgi:hypothetical protein
MVLPHVDKIEQQPNGTGGVKLALSVLLTGFEKDESVTITGYATQSSGSMVNIFATQTVESVSSDGVGTVIVYVTPPEEFKPEEDITIVISAAKVWMTVLKKDDTDPAPGTTTWKAEYYPGAPGQGGQGSAWGG